MLHEAFVRRPLHRIIRNAQGFEDFFVEVVVAIEQRLHRAEEHAGFRALNNAVIVGAGHRHHFADAERGDDVRRDADPDKVKARYANGCLAISVGKRESSRPRTIAIQ